MTNILIYSDLHITQSSLKECILILEEIGMLANKYNCDTLINLGDTFDNLKPTSSELDIFATFIRRLGNNKQHIILAANSHESTTQEESILNHYGILSDNIRIVKEYKDQNHLFCGHFSIKESSKNYDAKLSKEDFKNYLYVFLGHIHSYSLIKPNIVHLGSCRYINFDEAEDKQKIVALITDYGIETEKVHFLKLKSPISMIQLELGENPSNLVKNSPLETLSSEIGKDTELNKSKEISPINPPNTRQKLSLSELINFLNNLNDKTKVKIVIKDFENYRNFLSKIGLYQQKFMTFKVETDFEVISDNTQKCQSTEIKSFKESFSNWLRNQKIDSKITEILQKEVE